MSSISAAPNEVTPPKCDQASAGNAAPDASHKLSMDAFATPKDFLTELKKDYGQLSQSYPGYLTRYDLERAASTGGDTKMRAVAAITAEHFDDLQRMADGPYAGTKDYLTAKDIDTALILEKGDVDAYKKDVNHTSNELLLGTMTATSLLTAGALLTVEIPPISAVLAVAAVGAAGFEYLGIHKLNRRSDAAEASADKIQRTMASWPEVNAKR